MIIRCRKCGAKFRFDENLITKDGIWVRCSLCRHVFHQDRIGDMTGFPTETRIVSPEVQREAEHSRDITPAKERGDQDLAKVAEMPGIEDDIELEREGDGVILSRFEEIKAAGKEKDLDFAVKEFDDLESLSRGESDKEVLEEAVASEERKGRKKHSVAKFFAWFFLLLLGFLLMGGLYLWIFPQSGQQVLQGLFPYCPVIEKKWGKEIISRDLLLDHVKIQDVRQHFVNNWLMGNIRVVEGIAINMTDYSLTRIQMRGRLYDGENKVLAEQVSFCGNLLTDAELATFTEEEIQRKLVLPQGSNVSNDRIIPDGLIPFMIVFVHDPPGVAKTTVMTAGAEKLLE